MDLYPACIRGNVPYFTALIPSYIGSFSLPSASLWLVTAKDGGRSHFQRRVQILNTEITLVDEDASADDSTSGFLNRGSARDRD
jgi:hypothetical protein